MGRQTLTRSCSTDAPANLRQSRPHAGRFFLPVNYCFYRKRKFLRPENLERLTSTDLVRYIYLQRATQGAKPQETAMSSFSVVLCNSSVSVDTLSFRSGETDLISLQFDDLNATNFRILFSYEQAQKVAEVLHAAIAAQDKPTAAPVDASPVAA